MTHEIMQSIILGFLIAAGLVVIYSLVAQAQHKKRVAKRLAEVNTKLEGLEKQIYELNDEKDILLVKLTDNPFADLKNTHMAIHTNMTKSSELINELIQTYEANKTLDDLNNYPQTLNKIVTDFKVYDEKFNKGLSMLHAFIQKQQAKNTK